MGDCCEPGGYDTTFDDRFARRLVRRYRRRGLNRTQRRLVSFLSDRGIEGASVLEIGGGVGEIQVELLRRGARHVTNTEISNSYEHLAADLLAQAGMEGRVTRRIVDVATAPDQVEPADVVVLHRVVCCYPDYERLLSAAAGHARRLLVFSHPPPRPTTKAEFAGENLLRRLRGNPFRSFVHPPRAMIAVLESQGLRPTYRHRGWAWHIVGFER
jgi:magnesium-protoporphyrin O-methyltransferase